MKKTYTRIILIFVILLGLNFNTGCSKVDSDARKAVNVYLEGMKIFELSEGKQKVAATSWPTWGEMPVLMEYKTVYEGMFDTDIASIKGYKRLINGKVLSIPGHFFQ